MIKEFLVSFEAERHRFLCLDSGSHLKGRAAKPGDPAITR